MEQLQNNLAVVMAKRLLTVKEVSDGSGVNRNTVTLIRLRKAPHARLSTLIKLCDYLQVPLSELVEYDPKLKGGETDEDTTTD